MQHKRTRYTQRGARAPKREWLRSRATKANLVRVAIGNESEERKAHEYTETLANIGYTESGVGGLRSDDIARAR